MGDPVRILLLDSILKEIDNKSLIENVQITGKYLKDGLDELQVKNSPHIAKHSLGSFRSLNHHRPNIQQQLQIRGE